MKNIIIFDYDGVMVDSLDIVIGIYNGLCGKYNLKKINDKKEFGELFNNNFYDALKQKGATEEELKLIIIDFKNELTKHSGSINLFNDIKEMINVLSENNQLIIVTSNITQVVKEFLLSKGIKKIKHIIGADKERSKVKKILLIKSKNPQPKIYYIGDTTGDIIEGKEAGVVTIATTWGYHNREKLQKSNPDYIADSPRELVKLFKSLN
ncbi:HAD-IA family hydrolase [Patescibacteria group bacterium]|nr:HAD-IA family hydrolase [Patescibacteria group bacterium]MBU4347098.1 HAD-IA family hydrolase [Patescibacteria group bacterium]MBU4455687.1 HAD-IA family hydrolase [Patescibacteria group bacterium]MCG2691031.1 HAD-IA family hydrolase [Candidatus Parcubacteria bacterium]